MSTKISLWFHSFLDTDLLQKGVRVEIIRLLAKAEFKAKDGWTDPYIAIVDTGAPLSLIPQSIWEGCEVEILAEHSLKGVVPRKECVLPVSVGEVSLRIVDEENMSRELVVKAYLSRTDRVPLILGFLSAASGRNQTNFGLQIA
ncbi:MAG: hypothetical protein QME81_19765, partial [bacterium]|nr:hypothetical protein [bacterium]